MTECFSMQDQFHATFWVDNLGPPLIRYLNMSQLKSSIQSKKMAQDWELVILLAGCCAAMENAQALSQNCTEDTNIFLLEIKQEKPTDYGVQSKS